MLGVQAVRTFTRFRKVAQPRVLSKHSGQSTRERAEHSLRHPPTASSLRPSTAASPLAAVALIAPLVSVDAAQSSLRRRRKGYPVAADFKHIRPVLV